MPIGKLLSSTEVAAKFDAQRWVNAVDPRVTPRARRVAMALLELANAAGIVVLDRPALAAHAGTCVSTLKRAMAELQATGLIDRATKQHPHGGDAPNEYKLTLPEIEGGGQ